MALILLTVDSKGADSSIWALILYLFSVDSLHFSFQFAGNKLTSMIWSARTIPSEI